MPTFSRTNKKTGHTLIGLVDTGATNNYISEENIDKNLLLKLKTPISVKTIHGISQILSFIRINIFSRDLTFFILKKTGKFDLILGMNGLRKINAILDLTSLQMTYAVHHQLLNFVINDEINPSIKQHINELIHKNNQTQTLPFNTNVKATIRTTSKRFIV